MQVPRTVPHGDSLQRSQADLPALFPYGSCADTDGCAVLPMPLNCRAEEMKGQTRFLSEEPFAVWRKLRNFGPTHAEIPAWLCGSLWIGGGSSARKSVEASP